MINFRYHVVSLTAVFLALAIGLVVGTAALNGPAADALGDQVDALRKANTQLREQVGGLTDQANREEQFVTEAAPIMLDGKLAGKRVLLVSLPSGRDQVDGIAAKLTIAGAQIAGTVALQDKFFSRDENTALLDLAASAQPPSVPNTDLPFNSDGVETSSALLATVLLGRNPAITPADVTQVITAYSKAGYISADNNVTGGAEAVVFISGLPPVDRQAGSKNTALQFTLTQFDKVGVVVVGGVVGGDGNIVAEVRDDVVLAKSISTVDNANTAQGQVATALAVQEQLVKNQVGHYGIGPKSSSLLPQDKK
ncbi:copper transporter [Catelliglobosispora koreensis]|uniref:copper transporter n=1 Tax=Catelliglobosispora koreensis TaxID=129052 RepID=UPI00037B5D49|nr:copper transporter [Catelliglobosispora koreensis]